MYYMNKRHCKIYKIIDNETGEVYFGSTTQSINERINKHKKRPTCTCRDIIARNNFDVVVLETHIGMPKKELFEREKEYILKFNCVNKVIPNRTRKEYYEQNKEYLLKKKRWWYIRQRITPLLNTFIYKHMNKINTKQNKPPLLLNFVKITFNN